MLSFGSISSDSGDSQENEENETIIPRFHEDMGNGDYDAFMSEEVPDELTYGVLTDITYRELFNNFDMVTGIYEDDELYYNVEGIYQDDYMFLDSPKEDKKYYIGTCLVTTYPKSNSIDPSETVLNCCISPFSFFKNTLWTVKVYLYEFSILCKHIELLNNDVEILQLHIKPEDGTYTVVIKTVWLRIFQRKWRKWIAEKKAVIKHRMKISSLRHFEIHGRWPCRL